MNKKVTIIILCWNKWNLTRRCLETIKQYTDLTNVEVLVVDNGSTDETAAELKKISWIRVLTLPTNIGFVRGNNAGIESTNKENNILLLNNDIEILQSGWLKELNQVAYLDEHIGIVGCRLVMPDGKLLHAGTYILPDDFHGQQIGSLEKNIDQYNSDRFVQGIVFACAYIKRDVINAIGMLSLDYESYFEDTDYCLMAAEHGYGTMVAGKVTLMHLEHGSTSNDHRKFSQLFNSSREKFIAKWGKKLQEKYNSSIHFRSIMNVPSGYAMSCREIMKALDNYNVRTNYSYAYGPDTIHQILENENSGDYLLNIIAQRGKTDQHPTISVVYGMADVFKHNPGKYKIGYTMLEVDGFPEEWVRQSNLMDEIWTPSEFNKEGMIKSGVTKPIHVMPLGVNVDYFNPDIKPLQQSGEDYVFLSIFEWTARKNAKLLMQGFNSTFKATEKVVLICKIMNANPEVDVMEEIRKMELDLGGGRIVFIYNKEMPYYELGSLYRSANCYINVSHGEGWDMPLMEAMACGLPSIATRWGSHLQFINEKICYPLDIVGLQPATEDHRYYNGFLWATPDAAHYSKLLRHIFDNQDQAQEVGEAAAKEMFDLWAWCFAAERIKKRIFEILKNEK